MKKLFFLATILMALISCSRSLDDNSDGNETSKSKKLSQIIQDGKLQTSYLWQNNQLKKVENYTDGAVSNVHKISYENNLMKLDSLFDNKNTYLGRNIYNYTIANNLSTEVQYKIGFIAERRKYYLQKLNEGYINQQDYLILTKSLSQLYSPKMKKAVDAIPYTVGTTEYNNALYALEKSEEGQVSDRTYSYDANENISMISNTYAGYIASQQFYVYSNNRTNLEISTTNYLESSSGKYKAAYLFDGKKGIYSSVTPNKADWFYNTIERKLLENNNNIVSSSFNYKVQYTYDKNDYPLTAVETYENGKIINKRFVWID